MLLCTVGLESYHLTSWPRLDQVFFLNVKCHMSLELTNRDPTHTITLKHPNMAVLVLSGLRDVQVTLDIVHAGQNNIVVWTWTTRHPARCWVFIWRHCAYQSSLSQAIMARFGETWSQISDPANPRHTLWPNWPIRILPLSPEPTPTLFLIPGDLWMSPNN